MPRFILKHISIFLGYKFDVKSKHNQNLPEKTFLSFWSTFGQQVLTKNCRYSKVNLQIFENLIRQLSQIKTSKVFQTYANEIYV